MVKSYHWGRKRTTVVVTTVTGKSFWLDVKGSTSIAEVKAKLEEETSTTQTQQRLIYEGKVLEGHRTLSSYKIIKESVRDGDEWYNTLYLIPPRQ